jgi:hypothetical protein
MRVTIGVIMRIVIIKVVVIIVMVVVYIIVILVILTIKAAVIIVHTYVPYSDDLSDDVYLPVFNMFEKHLQRKSELCRCIEIASHKSSFLLLAN